MERLQKIIANAGRASRRQAEVLISAGKVTVNGRIVTDLGTKADPETARITVEGLPIISSAPVVYLLNKPKGVVCSRVQQAKEKLVTELVPNNPPVYPVGRLDRESEGLILLTNQGSLTQRLSHPSFTHPKTYFLVCKFQKGETARTPEWISQQLLKGVRLGDGAAKADKLTVKTLPEQVFTLEITVHEGRKHLLRRMCATIGLEVLLLRRTKFATLKLGNLKPGQYRRLSPTEISNLLHDTKTAPQAD